MTSTSIKVFPGMHGNASLLDEFQRLAPSRFDLSIHELPDDTWRYEDFLRLFGPDIEGAGKCILLGESFSGPLVVKLASQFPDVVAGVVLVATFVTPPTPWLAWFMPWSLMCRLPLPRSVVEDMMLGKGHELEFVQHVQNAVTVAPAQTMAGRMREVIRVRATDELASLRCPVLYVQATRDNMVPAKCLANIKQFCTDLTTVRLDGPHLILQTHAEEIWRHICEFVETN